MAEFTTSTGWGHVWRWLVQPRPWHATRTVDSWTRRCWRNNLADDAFRRSAGTHGVRAPCVGCWSRRRRPAAVVSPVWWSNCPVGGQTSCTPRSTARHLSPGHSEVLRTPEPMSQRRRGFPPAQWRCEDVCICNTTETSDMAQSGGGGAARVCKTSTKQCLHRSQRAQLSQNHYSVWYRAPPGHEDTLHIW